MIGCAIIISHARKLPDAMPFGRAEMRDERSDDDERERDEERRVSSLSLILGTYK
jgi:hypothetical protein